ncbi:MAG TPA: ATP-binding cassette domain-containing protein [Gaiellaceae bacterium]|jgi:ABC-2 type transport system ATP-binding protein|nr:ATP-binding cassette domain-containing protein [Gaiellaceae bacterium]
MIEVERLTKRYGKTVAVDDLTFRVESGRITGFLGPNGAGKTTTLKAVLALIRPTSGETKVLGRHYRDLDDPVRKVGAVLETSRYHPGRSGRNHLRVVAAQAGIARQRVEEVLELVALKDAARRRVGGYSLGMRQRLGLATALLGDPEVLILDEPANGLDPAGIRWLRDLLRQLAARGHTILISSHVLAEVEQIVDEVVIIHRGRFVTQSSTAALAAQVSAGVRVRSPEAERLRAALAAEGMTVAALDDGVLGVSEGTAERVGELAAANGIVLHELTPQKATLEEAFLELTGGETTT